MRTDELDFELPPELIAQVPPAERTDARLMHYRRAARSIAHHTFSDLPALLRPGDLLIFNDARVIPARITLRKQTGGRVEGLFLAEVGPGRWRVMLRNLGNAAGPLQFVAAPRIAAELVDAGPASLPPGEHEIRLDTDRPALEVLAEVGRMPLPPYIRRQKDRDPLDALDRDRYQTVFARAAGAVAAPTASLHFTDALLEQLASRGIERAFLTLDVGVGTFRPVTADALAAHDMHAERYTIPASTADALNRARAEGRRIIAVGTTAARALESQPADAPFVARTEETRLLIYPPYAWKHVDALLTNFHLPRSTLIALVAALVGRDEQRRLYDVAIEGRYRFFSYGDAMFIE